jgi:TonB family protein
VTLTSNTQTPAPAARQLAAEPLLRLGPVTRPLAVLTQEPTLAALLKKLAEGRHEVLAAASEVDLSTTLMTHHPGVALIDCAAAASSIAALTERLANQFPDLVLIVAGSVEEQGRLARQITDGSVHRFLHKPFSEQRLRLFVDAAWRRHSEGALPALNAPVRRAPQARRGRPWWLIPLALAAIAAPIVWFNLPVSSPEHAHTPALTAPAQRAGEDALESLLARAHQALEAGRLTVPAEASAAALYRAALVRAPQDARAQAGLNEVVARLLSQAEGELNSHQLEAAQQLVDQARGVSPDNPRVAFVAAQLAAQRDHAAVGKAQASALAQQQLATRVTEYLDRAREALERGALIEPAEDNARVDIESAHALAPDDPNVAALQEDLRTHLEAAARAALADKNPDLADKWASACQDAGADPARVAALREDAQELRLTAQRDALAPVAASFNQRLEQGRVMDPPEDSARTYLAKLVAADPSGNVTQLAHTAYNTRVLEEAKNALKAQDFAAAHRWLAEARAAGADASASGALDTALNAAEQAAHDASSYVTESSLTRTRYVPPTFPDIARARGIDGWVDLQFVVGTDGTVSDVAVVGAQPVGVFEQSALDAVRHWRYQPVQRDGHSVSQRVRVHVRFAVQK